MNWDLTQRVILEECLKNRQGVARGNIGGYDWFNETNQTDTAHDIHSLSCARGF